MNLGLDPDLDSLDDQPLANPCTPAQVSFIRDLLAQTGGYEEDWLDAYGADEVEELSVEEASEVIDGLKDARNERKRR